jgi:hypothetical protein
MLKTESRKPLATNHTASTSSNSDHGSCDVAQVLIHTLQMVGKVLTLTLTLTLSVNTHTADGW